MRTLEVHLNGKKLCVAGIGKNGVLSAVLNYRGGHGDDETALTIGGLLSDVDEYVDWVKRRKLRTGDEVSIRVLDSESSDTPKERYRFDPKAQQKEQQQYVRKQAKKWGWTILASKPPSGKSTSPKR